MNTIQYPKLAGLLRVLLTIIGWAAITAVLNFCSDQANLVAYLNPYLAGLLSMIAGAVEASMQSQGKGALFGAVK